MSKHILFVFGVAAVLVLKSCSAPPTEYHLRSEMELIVKDLHRSKGFNGVLGVLQKDQEPLLIYSGNQELSAGSPELGDEHYFHISSNSKLFTGLALLKLMERHKLKPSDPIGPYFPELSDALGRVSLRQLANHTSAIHDYLSLQESKEPPADNSRALELLSALDSTVYPPGERWAYTNSGYVLISLLVERVSGLRFQKFLEQEILSLFKIEQVPMHPQPEGVLSGYRDSIKADFDSRTIGDAGLYFSAREMVQFFENQDQIASYVHQAQEWASPWSDPKWEYGFGWFFSKDDLGPFRAHSGRSGGFESYLRINENQDLMFFILSNHANGATAELRRILTAKFSEIESNGEF